MTMTRRSALALVAGGASLAATRRARAQQWSPTRPVKLIVPYPAGGPTDAIGRIVANELRKRLDQNVVVENPSGASGAIGTRAVARAEPDGHTIVFGNNQTHGNNMFLLKAPGYDAVKDFAPLAGVGAFEHVFVVKNALPVRTMGELIELARRDPGKLNYGSTGIGSGSHLATELFMARTGTKMTHVPFRGAAPLVQELIAGNIDLSNSTLPSVLGQIQGGLIRAVGLASPQRNPVLPDLPTLREQGIAGADAESWAAFFAPAATPQPALDRLSREILALLASSEAKAAITKLGFSLNPRDPAAFRPYHQQEIQTWGEIIKAAGVPAEG